MLARVAWLLLVSCVHQQMLGAAGARCEAYSMELDAARLDPCSSFVVRGRGCFANSLQVDNDLVLCHTDSKNAGVTCLSLA